jgi:hypothetical protein
MDVLNSTGDIEFADIKDDEQADSQFRYYESIQSPNLAIYPISFLWS